MRDRPIPTLRPSTHDSPIVYASVSNTFRLTCDRRMLSWETEKGIQESVTWIIQGKPFVSWVKQNP
jgi:hypothetical protein